MISDSKLKKISLAVALAGVFAIYVVSLLAAVQTSIAEITQKGSGKIVTVTAKIESYSSSNGNIFLRLEDATGNITVVIFGKTSKPEIAEGDTVIAEGQVNIYKGELEIVVNSVSKIS